MIPAPAAPRMHLQRLYSMELRYCLYLCGTAYQLSTAKHEHGCFDSVSEIRKPTNQLGLYLGACWLFYATLRAQSAVRCFTAMSILLKHPLQQIAVWGWLCILSAGKKHKHRC